MEQIFCSASEVTEDIGYTGLSEAALMSKITAASQHIEQNIYPFLPIIDTRSFSPSEMIQPMSYYARGMYGTNANIFPGSPDRLLMTSAILSLTSVVVGGVSWSLGDVILWPDNALWIRGPYYGLQIQSASRFWSTRAQDNVITGTWGFYDETVSLGATASQLIGDGTIVMTDGSKLSAGMVVKIEAEWELVTATSSTTTNTTATLNGAIDDELQEIPVSDGTKMSVGEVLKVDFEQMKILDISANVILVTRGWNGTKRILHNTAAAIYAFRTYLVSRAANGSTAAAHTSAAINRQVAPADVNYLCRQMASLMIKKAQTGFVGTAGNNELGQAFFVNEFPKNQIESVKQNYMWVGY